MVPSQDLLLRSLSSTCVFLQLWHPSSGVKEALFVNVCFLGVLLQGQPSSWRFWLPSLFWLRFFHGTALTSFVPAASPSLGASPLATFLQHFCMLWRAGQPVGSVFSGGTAPSCGVFLLASPSYWWHLSTSPFECCFAFFSACSGWVLLLLQALPFRQSLFRPFSAMFFEPFGCCPL